MKRLSALLLPANAEEMDDLDRRIRRKAKLLLLVGFGIGLLAGIPVGLFIAESYGTKTIVLTTQPSTKV